MNFVIVINYKKFMYKYDPTQLVENCLPLSSLIGSYSNITILT
jgi:hypothetical protein